MSVLEGRCCNEMYILPEVYRYRVFTAMTKQNLPNYITGLRIAGTTCLILVRPLSMAFFLLYTLTGLTDVLDGWIARKMKLESELGAKLDSSAGLLLYTVMFLKIFPILWSILPMELWYMVGIVIVLRVLSYGIAVWKYRRFPSLHTWMNKLTGVAVFLVPYGIRQNFAIPFCWMVWGIAVLASAEELLIHVCSREYRANVKTIFAWRR